MGCWSNSRQFYCESFTDIGCTENKLDAGEDKKKMSQRMKTSRLEHSAKVSLRPSRTIQKKLREVNIQLGEEFEPEQLS